MRKFECEVQKTLED